MVKMTGRVSSIRRDWMSGYGAPETANLTLTRKRWTKDFNGEPHGQDSHYEAEITMEMAKEIKLGDLITFEVRQASMEEEFALIADEQKPGTSEKLDTKEN